MSTTTTTTLSADEWQVGRLDLDAYLHRVGVEGELAPDLATLRALHRAHADRIPFENLDILLGRGIDLGLDAIQDKLVRRPRGGYCFEHNSLFAAVLERLGFVVSRHLGRVTPSNRGGARTHMLLRVEIDGAPWLADVGFGASLLDPIPMREGPSRQGAWEYRLDRDDQGWLLSARSPTGWADQYAFTLEPQRPVDFAVANHYTATHPDSPFTSRVVALRTEPEIQYALRRGVLHTTRADGPITEREISARDLVGVLADVFGIRLAGDEATALRARHAASPGRPTLLGIEAAA